MTPAQSLRIRGWNASVANRGVSLSMKCGSNDAEPLAVVGLIEAVTEKTYGRIRVLDNQTTHIVHVLRSDIVAGEVAVDAVTEIERADDAEKTYRVKVFDDDTQRPAVMFHCVLA
jgi:hypothetical protein